MFENLKENICKDLMKCSLENIDEYIYELHEILPNYVVNVPEQQDYEFYKFAAKFMEYLIDKNSRILSELDENVCKIFTLCYDEIYSITNALNAQTNDDITSDLINILSSAKDNNIVDSEENCQNFLDSIFTFTNHDWENLQYVDCNWSQVMNMIDFNLDNDIDLIDSFISNLFEKHPEEEIQYDELVEEYNEAKISGFVALLTIGLELKKQGWIVKNIPDSHETWIQLFVNNSYMELEDFVNNILLEEYDMEITESEIEEELENHNIENLDIFTVKEYLEGEGWSVSSDIIDINNDEFIATGYKGTSNLGGREIQISESGDSARIKYEDESVSDWCEIQYTNIDEFGDITNESLAYIDIEGNNNIDDFEYLNSYTKY